MFLCLKNLIFFYFKALLNINSSFKRIKIVLSLSLSSSSSSSSTSTLLLLLILLLYLLLLLLLLLKMYFLLYLVDDGGYSEWSSWSQCSKTCGDGRHSRSRSCTNPPPSPGGKDCSQLGPDTEYEDCSDGGCPG